MSIIESIRLFLRLDKRVVSIDADIIDSIGLHMNEPKQDVHEFGQCLSGDNFSVNHKHDLFHAGAVHMNAWHFSHDIPTNHF